MLNQSRLAGWQLVGDSPFERMSRYTDSWCIFGSWLWQCSCGALGIWYWESHIWTSCKLASYLSSAWVIKLVFFFPVLLDDYLIVIFWMLKCKQLTFKDINGLVQQNAQLRSLVRNLSDQLENREKEFKVCLNISTTPWTHYGHCSLVLSFTWKVFDGCVSWNSRKS